MFVVRYSAAHGKGNLFTVRLTLTHGEGDEQPNGVNVRWGKNVCTNKNARLFAVRQIKTHGKLFFYRTFFCKTPLYRAPEICVRRRAAIIVFPVV
jgi:hypothetical protein